MSDSDDTSFTLRPGAEISTSADARVRRAVKLYSDAEWLLRSWRESEPMVVRRRYDPATNSLAILAELDRLPDLEQLALIYSEIGHQLWAARENLWHDILNLPGVRVRGRNHYFPTKATAESWDEVEEAYGSVPAPILKRIRRLQPFTDARDDGTTSEDYVRASATYATREANRIDKHRTVGTCRVLRFELPTGSGILWRGGSPSFVEAEADSDPQSGEPFRSMSLDPEGEILSYPIQVGIQVSVQGAPDRAFEPLLQTAAVMIVQGQFDINAIRYGFDYARAHRIKTAPLDVPWYDLLVTSQDDPSKRSWECP